MRIQLALDVFIRSAVRIIVDIVCTLKIFLYCCRSQNGLSVFIQIIIIQFCQITCEIRTSKACRQRFEVKPQEYLIALLHNFTLFPADGLVCFCRLISIILIDRPQRRISHGGLIRRCMPEACIDRIYAIINYIFLFLLNQSFGCRFQEVDLLVHFTL